MRQETGLVWGLLKGNLPSCCRPYLQPAPMVNWSAETLLQLIQPSFRCYSTIKLVLQKAIVNQVLCMPGAVTNSIRAPKERIGIS